MDFEVHPVGTEKKIRLSVPIDESTNDALNELMPWGVKAEVIRKLVDCLLRAQIDSGRYIIKDLLDGNCTLRSNFEQEVGE